MNTLLEELRQALESSTDGMSEEEMKRHPAGKWCVAEVLEHLYLTYTGTVKGFSRVLDAGKPLVGRASFRQRLQTCAVLVLNYFPEGRTAPKMTVPKGLPPGKLRADVATQIAVMDGIIDQCDARFRRRKLLDHPILGPLTAKQWRKFHLIHGRHHVKQILRLRAWAAHSRT